MSQVFVVRRTRGPAWDHTNPLNQQADWDEHAAFMDLYPGGFVLLAGPIEEANAALMIVRANSVEEFERRLSEGPVGAGYAGAERDRSLDLAARHPR